jgi:hypothetical protein
MNKICYDCGKPLTKENITVEHVPAKNLYEGFNDDYKKNRITVLACYDCNQKYSKIDQEIRDALAIKNESTEEKQDLTGKGVRSILRRSNWKDRTHYDINGQVTAVDFSYKVLQKIHIKNFKALFFRKYGFPVPDNFEINIIADGDESDLNKMEAASIIHDYLSQNSNFEISGHPDIFKFVIKDLTPIDGSQEIYESGDFDKLYAVGGLMVYHDQMAAVVVASNQKHKNAWKNSKKHYRQH